MQGISCTPMPTCQGGWAGGRPYHFPLLKGEPQAKTMRNSVMQQMQKGGGGRDWDFHTPVLCLALTSFSPYVYLFRWLLLFPLFCLFSPAFPPACPPALPPRRVGLGVEENPKHGACAGYSPFLLLFFFTRGFIINSIFLLFQEGCVYSLHRNGPPKLPPRQAPL